MEPISAGVAALSVSSDAIGTTVIDVDVHESFPIDRLLPYLDPIWQRYITEWGFTGPAFALPYIAAAPTRTDRDPPAGGAPGSDLGWMRHQLFEEQTTSAAILNNPIFTFSTMESRYEFAIALASAYNDYVIEMWLEKEPRLRGSIQVVAHEPVAAAREIDRVGGHPQMVQVILPTVSNRQYGDPFYRPILEAALRNRLVIAMHQTHATKTVLGYPRYYVEWHTLAHPQSMMAQVVSFIYNGAFDKYPDLKLVCLESGFTWVPHLMFRMDGQYVQHRQEVPWLTRKPSEHMRDCVRVATQPMEGVSGKQLMQLIDQMGTDQMLLFASDYPHYDEDNVRTVFPDGIPNATRRRILGDNAINTYPRLNTQAR